MNSVRLLAIAIAVALLMAGAEYDLSAGKPQPNIPLRVEFDDLSTHHMRSDGAGAYRHGIDNVVAYINGAFHSSFTFASDTQGSGPRRLSFDFATCLSPDGCDAPFTTGLAPAGIQAAPRDENGAPLPNGLLAMDEGETLPAFYQIQVKGQPDEWTLCMKPENEGFCVNSPNGTWGRVTRIRTDAWEFFASSEEDAWGERSDVADLLKTSGSGRRKTITLEGTFSLPFRFTASCVNAAACSS